MSQKDNKMFGKWKEKKNDEQLFIFSQRICLHFGKANTKTYLFYKS